MSQVKTPTVLVILDGWGMASNSLDNAIAQAKTPNFDYFFREYPATTLKASGTSVGLDDNQVSGSETGHMNIGAGRIILQDSHYISESIQNGSFFDNPVLVEAARHAKNFQGKFHVMGLMSDSDSPHSNPEHFRALLRMAKRHGITEVYCHLFTDGRDSYPRSALDHLRHFRGIMQEERIGKIATIGGRFFAMDRSKNWKRMAVSFDTIVFARGEKSFSAEEVIRSAYKNNLTDEYIVPTVIFTQDNLPVAKLEKNDTLIFFNYRSDRARQFSKLFAADNPKRILEDDMPVIDQVPNLYFVAMTDFGPDLNIHTAFPGHTLKGTLPMALKNFRQLYIAEREKYAHVTYFINGGYADSVAGEERVMVESVKTDSYVRFPEMSAREITKRVVDCLDKNSYDFVVVNFANADMVGHTGDMAATKKAVECVDECMGRIADVVLLKNGTLAITADHGNADHMFDGQKDDANTFHTKNPVPFILVSREYKGAALKSDGALGNIAPTILEVMGVAKPQEMTCESLIKK